MTIEAGSFCHITLLRFTHIQILNGPDGAVAKSSDNVLVDRERNVFFNDALNTFYQRLYGVRHMVKDHSDSDKGNPLSPHRLLLSINSKGSFICTIPQTG